MNTLEWYYETVDHLKTFIGKEVPDATSPTGKSVVESFNSRTSEFTLTNSSGTKRISYLELEQIIDNI